MHTNLPEVLLIMYVFTFSIRDGKVKIIKLVFLKSQNCQFTYEVVILSRFKLQAVGICAKSLKHYCVVPQFQWSIAFHRYSVLRLRGIHSTCVIRRLVNDPKVLEHFLHRRAVPHQYRDCCGIWANNYKFTSAKNAYGIIGLKSEQDKNIMMVQTKANEI